MTILIASHTPDLVRICANTGGFRVADGSPADTAKIFPFPMFGGALAGAGQMATLVNVFVDLWAGALRFDGMLAQLGATLRTRVIERQAEYAGAQLPHRSAMEDASGFDITDMRVLFGGWSEEQQSMRLVSIEARRSGYEGCVLSTTPVVNDFFASPWGGVPGNPPDSLPDESAMVALARRIQAAYPDPAQACGGNLLLAELTRESVSLKMVLG